METFPCPSDVKVADSVTLKLSPTNYFAWKNLMLAFFDSHHLCGFVDGTLHPPSKPSPLAESSVLEEKRREEEEKRRELMRRNEWDQKHTQQREWENESEQERLRELVREQERMQEWEQEQERPEGEREREQVRRENWKREWGEEWKSREEQERQQEWDRERERRKQWDWERERREKRKQERREEERIYTGWKRSDGLVRGWILAMLTEEILLQVMHLVTAREVWIKLKKILTPPFQLSQLELIDWTDQKRGQILSQYMVLHKAALTADWDTADKFLDLDPDAFFQPITWCLETALIVAVRSAKRNHFVKKVMEKMQREGVALIAQQDISGATALHAAVDGGNIEAAKWLVQKNSELANIGDKYGTLAVHVAAGLGNREMVDFLLQHTTNLSENESGLKLLHSLASSGLYDIALTYLQQNRKLASMEPSPLVVITQKRTSFLSGTSLSILQHLIYFGIPLKLEDIANHPQERDIENPAKCVVSAMIYVKQKLTALFWDVAEKLDPFNSIKSLRETKLIHHQALNLVKCLCEEVVKTDFPNAAKIFTEPLRNATCLGIHEIVEEILESFPSAIHLRSERDQSLFHLAIVYRRENVFNLIYQMEEDRRARAFLSMPDASTNNALHSAGNLALQQQLLLRASAPGAALQMQRELQWFEEVGNFILPQAKEHMNADGKTPQEVFTDTHKDLVKEGEQWMKDTSNSCSIVAALITTIVFAAAITVPGGSNGNSGLPLRLGNRAFTLFGIFDALAMFSSSSSLLMFLSILTSRYGEQDFLYSLPRRLIIGLVTLFLSIISMMVAFGATLKIVFGETKAWIVIPVAVLSCVPVTLFVLLQFPLLLDMIKSTYYPGIFKKQSNRILH
ncbi:protein ACCELERATED CELL DEATH 6-like isoform X1 [Rhododendron vialii]|uniref:protein ACCELERATED CELL DEATH 6-like isoform X1 n=1 Tax=Rhododendron vialii TaxID=182163 RepID=UPI00266038B5|nr:protein ACCELERATED CELL DEATH 6-like isoform X1 [Rhododendron vialii]